MHGTASQLPIVPSSDDGRIARLPQRRVARSPASLLQCDVCERYACADCLSVYDILSGYDFLCDACAREIETASVKPGH